MTPIEQVARAMWDRLKDDTHSGIAWDHHTMDDQRLRLRRMAAAAIEAMREPTDEMMVEAEDAVPALTSFAPKEKSLSYIAWQAMIDAALAQN